MIAIKREDRRFGAVGVSGLTSESGFLDLLIALFRDAETRALLEQAVTASVALEGDAESAERGQAKARLDEALDGLERAGLGAVLYLPQESAITLRKALLGARLGEGRADDWQARRRVA